MQYAYEDRISELRAQVDRTTSRQLLDQEQFEKKLDQIVRRQTTLGIANVGDGRDAGCHRHWLGQASRVASSPPQRLHVLTQLRTQ